MEQWWIWTELVLWKFTFKQVQHFWLYDLGNIHLGNFYSCHLTTAVAVLVSEHKFVLSLDGARYLQQSNETICKIPRVVFRIGKCIECASVAKQ